MNHVFKNIALHKGIIAVLFLFVQSLSAQISPGELSQAHAHLEGISNCTKCHILGEKVSNDKCLACHKEIATSVSGNSGYHASAEVKGKECAGCHNDHHGRKFEMIRFDKEHFNHNLTGYMLEGKHASTDCNACHKSEFIKNDELKKRSNTYLGLNRQCSSCHTDYHQGTLSENCTSCHDFNSFRPATKFDHNNTGFRLLGKHAQVDCKLCHKVEMKNGREMQLFKGIPFGNCTSCHRDIHENKFGQNCTKCHSEVSFHQIKGVKNFNHSLTNFELRGKHAAVACASCHKKGYTQNLKYNRCSDCHKDYHRNQFAVNGSAPDCKQCHSENGFTPSSYTIEKHNQSPFILKGAHLATPCFECHKKTDTWNFRGIGKVCGDCHKNIHESTLDIKYYPDYKCTACHQEERWNEVSFDHGLTGYQLEGAHRKQSCRSCHYRSDQQGAIVQQFSQLSSACLNCHREVHHNQFETEGTMCLKCHDYFDWTAGEFNHDRTAFPLDGKHKNVACAKCHPRTGDGAQSYTLYKLKTFTCESCH